MYFGYRDVYDILMTIGLNNSKFNQTNVQRYANRFCYWSFRISSEFYIVFRLPTHVISREFDYENNCVRQIVMNKVLSLSLCVSFSPIPICCVNLWTIQHIFAVVDVARLFVDCVLCSRLFRETFDTTLTSEQIWWKTTKTILNRLNARYIYNILCRQCNNNNKLHTHTIHKIPDARVEKKKWYLSTTLEQTSENTTAKRI